jgi:hypothetical protein
MNVQMAGMIRAGLWPSSVMSVKAHPGGFPAEFAAQPAHLAGRGGDQHWLSPVQAAAHASLDRRAELGGTAVEEGTVQEAVAGGHRFGPHPPPCSAA